MALFSISEDLHRFAKNLQHLNAKLFLLLFLNNFKHATPRNNNQTILCSYAANFLQICVRFQNYWTNAMSKDGLIIENMDLSHIHLAVPTLSSERQKLDTILVQKSFKNLST